MGAVDLGADKPQGKKKGLRRPKRRVSIKLDMTPMVDIAFLLLIFYMVSTIFAQPQAMEVNLPPDSDVETETAQSRVLTIRVDDQDRFFWNMAQDPPEQIELAALPKMLEEKVQAIAELVTVIKINKGARYQRMVELLDRIEIVEYRMRMAQKAAIERGELPADTKEFSYTFALAPWTRLDSKNIEQVTGEAEPPDEE